MQFLLKQWFLFLLFLAMAAGLALGDGLSVLASSIEVRNGIVFAVMFAMALPLELRAFLEVLKKPSAALLACVTNMAVLPFVVAMAMGLMSGPTAAGFAVVAATPCTLASAAVWTRKAGGNDAVALMVTVLTNGFCFILTPAIVWCLLGSQHSIEPAPMILRLVLLVVIPIGLAQFARCSKKVGAFAANRKAACGVFAQVGILTMVLIAAANTRTRWDAGHVEMSLQEVCLIVLAAVLLHGLLLVFGYFFSRLIRLGQGNAIAVGIAGSQKTLMVGLLVCDDLQITILPMVIYHAVQLLMDTLFVEIVRDRTGHD